MSCPNNFVQCFKSNGHRQLNSNASYRRLKGVNNEIYHIGVFSVGVGYDNKA